MTKDQLGRFVDKLTTEAERSLAEAKEFSHTAHSDAFICNMTTSLVLTGLAKAILELTREIK